MKQLTKGVFYVKKGQPDALEQTRLFHDCEGGEFIQEDRKRILGAGRRELAAVPDTETEDVLLFGCPACGFAYPLDKHLTLA